MRCEHGWDIEADGDCPLCGGPEKENFYRGAARNNARTAMVYAAYATELRALVEEALSLVKDGKVQFVADTGGGVWTWPERAEHALRSNV